MGQYLTAPIPSKEMPKGIPYIIGNEAAERFSFYGMRVLLFVFMTQYLTNAAGEPAVFTETEAREYQAWFTSAAYLTPFLGAFVSDALWGKYKTILYVSLLYCLGHGFLSLMDAPQGFLEATFEPKGFFLIGLVLIALGAGGIKPCVSANVGDQFGATNKHLIEKVFGWFYFSINFGSFFSTLLTPWLLEEYGPGVAFGVPGVLMGVATLAFWMGRRKFVHIPPSGTKAFTANIVEGGGYKVILKLLPLYALIAVFWSCYDQSASAWVGQASRMDRSFLGIEWLESQVQAVNPLLILLFIPLFNYALYPAVGRFWKLTPLRKMGIGMFLTVATFALSSVIEQWTVDARAAFDRDHAPRIEAGEAELVPALRLLEEDGRHGAAETLLEGHFGRATVALYAEATGAANLSEWDLDLLATIAQRAAVVDAELAAGAAPSDVVAERRKAERALASAAVTAGSELAPLAPAGAPTPTDVSAAAVAARNPGAWFAAGAVAYGGTPEPIHRPGIIWQLLAFVLLTAAEVMVSITSLEFSYTQAPQRLKSLVMAFYLFSVSAGNFLTALVNNLTADADGNSTLVGASYYWFFTGVMGAASLLFVLVALVYKPREYLQEERPAA